jgi:hypothetical protein
VESLAAQCVPQEQGHHLTSSLAQPKTFKNFSYWENWPSPTGHAPSLDVLAHLAELYECRLVDLLVDCANFSHRDHVHLARRLLVRACRIHWTRC